MNGDIAEELLDAGIIQYGRFQAADHAMPFRILPDYLPAYPTLLVRLAQTSLASMPPDSDRILVDRESLPLGVALSIQSSIPLVYSRSQSDDAAFDLVGAYNSGHRAVMLMAVLDGYDAVDPVITRARRVGLVVQQILALISVQQPENNAGLRIAAVLQFDEITRQLGQLGRIPDAHVRLTLDWLTANR